MSTELETAAEASAGGWLRWRRGKADIPPGAPCANCGTPLAGTYCHGCGQLAEDFHKSIWKLVVEALESFFHLDGRLARTLPRLLARPGQLTRDYLDGKRASQVPPLRLFLVILLLTFLVGQCAMSNSPGAAEILNQAQSAPLDNARAAIEADATLTEQERKLALAAVERNLGGVTAALDATREAGRTVATEAQDPASRDRMVAFQAWVNSRLEAIQAEPGRFGMVMGVWAQRVVIMSLPVSALILTCLFFWRRDVFVFDHVIFSMHSLSFQLLLLTAIFLLAMGIGPAAWFLLFLSPVHLFVHMRGAYRSGAFATLLRMFLLFTATTIAASLMLLLWLFLAFNEMSG